MIADLHDSGSSSPLVQADTCPLTAQEKTRLDQLEHIVDQGLVTFKKVGAALIEIRSSRLYRGTHPTFEAYLRERYALALSTANQIIKSAQTAELLESNGAHLPEGMSEAAVRPLNALGDAALQKASWDLIQAACPDRTPSQPVVSKIVRIIRNSIEPQDNRNGNHPSREVAFVAPIQRLSKYDGFDAQLVTAHIAKLPSAWSVYTACDRLIERCQAVRHILAERFPELEQEIV